MDEIKVIKKSDKKLDLAQIAEEQRLSNIESIVEQFEVPDHIAHKAIINFLNEAYTRAAKRLPLDIPRIPELIIKKIIENVPKMQPILGKDIKVFFHNNVRAHKGRIIAANEEVTVTKKIAYNQAMQNGTDRASGHSYVHDFEKGYRVARGVQLLYEYTKASFCRTGDIESCTIIEGLLDAIKQLQNLDDDGDAYFSSKILNYLHQINDSIIAQIPERGIGTPGELLYKIIYDTELTKYDANRILTGSADSVALDVASDEEIRKNDRKSALAVHNKIMETSGYLAIIRENFTGTLFEKINNEMLARPYLRLLPDRILELAGKDAKIIKRQYEARQKLLEDLSKNMCPHLRDISLIRKSPKQRRRQMLITFLEKWSTTKMDDANMSSDKKWVPKNSGKNERVPCRACKQPLLCPHVIYVIMNPNEIEETIRSDLFNYIVDAGDYLYCDNCGETLLFIGHEEKMQDFSERGDDEIDPLYADLLREIGGLIYRHFEWKTGTARDYTDFVVHMRDELYPAIRDKNKQISKIRTQTKPEAQARLRLYIAFYTFAYMAKYITDNRGPLKVVLAEAPKVVELRKLIRTMVPVIADARASDIAKMSYVSSNDITEGLGQAFSSIATPYAGRVQKKQDQGRAYLANVLADPVYNYLRTRNIGQHPGAILGFNFHKMSEYIESRSKGKRSKSDDGKKMLEYPWGRSKIRNGTEADQLFHKEFLIGRSFENNPYKRTEPGFYHVPQFNAEDTARAQLTDQTLRLRKYEDPLIVPIYSGTRFEYINDDHRIGARAQGGLAAFTFRPDLLHRQYDSRGKQKQFTYAPGKTDKPKSSTDTVYERIILRGTINDVLRFYETKCPVDGTAHRVPHKKCGHSHIPDEEFFKKWFKKYTNDKKAATETVHRTRSSSDQEYDFSNMKEQDGWTGNYKTVSIFAEKYKLSYPHIVALGAYEGTDLAEIESNAESLPKTQVRAYNLEGKLQQLYAHYNKILNIHRAPNVPAYITKIVEPYGAAKMRKLSAKMPKLKIQNKAVKYFIQKKSPNDAVDYILITMVNTLANIYNDKHEETKKIRNQFVVQFMKHIIAQEKRLLKPGYFPWEAAFSSDYDASAEQGAEQAELPLGNYKDQRLMNAIDSGDAHADGEEDSLDAFDYEESTHGEGDGTFGENEIFNVE